MFMTLYNAIPTMLYHCTTFRFRRSVRSPHPPTSAPYLAKYQPRPRSSYTNDIFSAPPPHTHPHHHKNVYQRTSIPPWPARSHISIPRRLAAVMGTLNPAYGCCEPCPVNVRVTFYLTDGVAANISIRVPNRGYPLFPGHSTSVLYLSTLTRIRLEVLQQLVGSHVRGHRRKLRLWYAVVHFYRCTVGAYRCHAYVVNSPCRHHLLMLSASQGMCALLQCLPSSAKMCTCITSHTGMFSPPPPPHPPQVAILQSF